MALDRRLSGRHSHEIPEDILGRCAAIWGNGAHGIDHPTASTRETLGRRSVLDLIERSLHLKWAESRSRLKTTSRLPLATDTNDGLRRMFTFHGRCCPSYGSTAFPNIALSRGLQRVYNLTIGDS